MRVVGRIEKLSLIGGLLTILLFSLFSVSTRAEDAVEPSAPLAEPPPRALQQSAFWLGVPMLVNAGGDVVRPGFDFAGRVGAAFGAFVPGITGGFSVNGIDFAEASENPDGTPVDPMVQALGRQTMTKFWFSLGLLVQDPHEDRMARAYGSLAFDLNFWKLLSEDADLSGVCDWWYCRGYRSYRFTPGVSMRAGVQLELKENVVLDLGLRAAWSGTGDYFVNDSWWLTPYGGMTFRR